MTHCVDFDAYVHQMCIKCAPEDDPLGDETCWSDVWVTECYTDTTQKLPVDVDTTIDFKKKHVREHRHIC